MTENYPLRKYHSLDMTDRHGKRKADKEECLRFMREKFSAKECSRFVPKRSKTDRFGTDVCYCGGFPEEHDENSMQRQPRRSAFWTTDDIHKMSTNAFGKIRFSGLEFYQKPAKYIRLSDDTEIGDAVKLMETYWGMTESNPEILVSIYGDLREFTMTDSMKDTLFNRGLIPAVETARGWISTFGLEIGVSKAVGDAIKQSEFLYEKNGRVKRIVHCIGIAPWGYVQNRKDLIVGDDVKEEHLKSYKHVDMPVGAADPAEESLPLNPYHSHFLLVDDGKRNKERSVAEFRAALEKKISEPMQDGGLGIPVICMLVGGGLRSIENIERSVAFGLPVLICEGSGRASDVILQAYKSYKDMSPTGKPPDLSPLEKDIMVKLEKALHQNDDDPEDEEKRRKKLAKAAKQILSICQNSKSVFFVHISRSEKLEAAILMCLLECQSGNVEQQLNLALRWDRADVAKARIFDNNFQLDGRNMTHAKFFTEALINNQLEFVKLFIDHGFPLNAYLTVERLREIYLQSLDGSTLIFHLLDLKEESDNVSGFYLKEIHELIRQLTRRFHYPKYSQDSPLDEQLHGSKAEKHFSEEPYQDLFLWAVLLNRQDAASYFWEKCEEPLIAAVSATLICDRLSEKSKKFSTELSKQCDANKDKFEKKAIGLLDVAFKEDKEKALHLIHVKSSTWDDMSCLELAAVANDVDFLATPCCQTSVNSEWKPRFDASGIRLVFCTFTIWPIFWLVRFEDDFIYLRHSLLAGQHQTDSRYKRLKRSLSAKSHVMQRHIKHRGRTGSEPVEIVCNSPSTTPFLAPVVQPKSQATSKKSKLTPAQKIILFFRSPVIKFVNHVFWYGLFLLLHAYVVLFAFRWRITVPEIVLHLWTLTFFCEFVRMIFLHPANTVRNKFMDYWEYSSFTMWNRLEMLNFLLFALILLTRWISYTFFLARLFLTCNFILFMFRMYKYFMINSYLGPKVIMMLRMTRDLFMFLMLLIVLMISYAVSSQALLHPHRPYFGGVYYDLFDHGIWDIFGDLNSIITEPSLPECGIDPTINNGTRALTMAEKDCWSRRWPVPLLLAVYLFFGNILLVNMLIAIFASIFAEVQTHSEQIWKSLMYFLVVEYRIKPLLPCPLVVFNWLYLLCAMCCRRRKPLSPIITARKQHDDQHMLKSLNVFESNCRAKYLEQQKLETDKSIETVTREINENVNKMHKFLSNIKFKRSTTKELAPPTPRFALKFSGGPIDTQDGGRDSLFNEYEENGDQDSDMDIANIIYH